jgi:hypothetical protein
MHRARPMTHAPRLPFVILAAAFSASVLLVGGCVQVGDRLAGVSLSRGRPTTCIKDCNDQYKQLYVDEQKAHLEAKALCGAVNCAALPKRDQAACMAARQACQKAEAVRHEAAMDALNRGKVACRNNCHHQGSGMAG